MRMCLVSALMCALALTVTAIETQTARASLLATNYNLTSDARAYVASGPDCAEPRRELSQIIRVGVSNPICKSENDTSGWRQVKTVEISPFTTQLVFVYALFSIVLISIAGDSSSGLLLSQLTSFALTSIAVGLDFPSTADNHSTPVTVYIVAVVVAIISFKPNWWTSFVWLSFVYFVKMFADVFPQFDQLEGFASVMDSAATWALAAYAYFSIGLAFTVILGYLRSGIFVVMGTWATITALVLHDKANLAYFVGTVVSVASLLASVRFESAKSSDEIVTEAPAEEVVESKTTRAASPAKQQQSEPSKPAAAPRATQPSTGLETFQSTQRVETVVPIVEREPVRPAKQSTTIPIRVPTEIPIHTPSPTQAASHSPVKDTSAPMDLDKKGIKRGRGEDSNEPNKYQKL